MDALFILGTVKTFFEGAKRVYNTMKKREIVKTSTYIYIYFVWLRVWQKWAKNF